jgi:hypothetical protein
VHIVVGPCAKGHFIHARSFLDPEFFFFFLPISELEGKKLTAASTISSHSDSSEFSFLKTKPLLFFNLRRASLHFSIEIAALLLPTDDVPSDFGCIFSHATIQLSSIGEVSRS